MSKGLYIHVPFCRRKCAYCDFYSQTDLSLGEDYVNAVIRNIKAYNEKYDTVYFGGGTPSLLSPQMISRIISAADIDSSAEITAECNPDSASPEKLVGYRSAGVNRLSVGIQSLDDKELAALGRLHNSEQTASALKNAAKAGFENISADLMLGIPFQTAESVKKNIAGLSALGITHLSAYMLKIEEGTPLSRDKSLINSCADEDTLAEFYDTAVNALENAGLHRYEISNFSKKGYECRHNLKYWRCEDYIGIGPSAHSCAYGKRFAVYENTEDFIKREKQETYITEDTPYSEEERLMLSLRLTEGYNAARFPKMLTAASTLEQAGFLTISDDRIRLTTKGFLVSNEIICILAEKGL